MLIDLSCDNIREMAIDNMNADKGNARYLVNLKVLGFLNSQAKRSRNRNAENIKLAYGKASEDIKGRIKVKNNIISCICLIILPSKLKRQDLLISCV
ncbi:MAG: hypothetical protein PHY88_02300 [Candidatus Omnitrophica bacterium]|nr:hypothetical protein [Candidatus Omnitrophota bacterium]